MPSSSRFPWLPLILVLAVGGAAWIFLRPGNGDERIQVPTHLVARRPLRVTVLESGSIEALSSQTITSRMEGKAAILFIIPEGTIITDEDVREKRLLVQLDVASLEEKLNSQKIDLAQAVSAYENAVSTLDIQRQQNASEIRKAQLEVRFARLDLERYVGKILSSTLLAACACAPEPPPDEEAALATPTPGGSDTVPTFRVGTVAPERMILGLLEDEDLEGEARQTIRRLDSDISLANEEFKRQQVRRDWTTRLLDKGYVSRDEEEADRIGLERRRIDLEQARTARQQFVVYDFRKQVEQLLSNLIEAEAQFDRTKKRAVSSEAREVSGVRSRKEQRQLKAARFVKLQDQIAAAQIHASQPGLVVYASSRRRRRWRSDDAIQEGTIVQERQPIIEIPDLTSLGVKVSVHESVVERVQEGQAVTVVMDAFKDRPIPGVVAKVARLPDPPDSWLNPDLKVYSTEIRLLDIPDDLRPGLSAQVEILVADLGTVIAVPVQAVAGTADHPIVEVVTADGTEKRSLVLGLSNDVMVEVKEGLEPGETILLAPKRSTRLASGRGNPAAKKDGPKKPAGGGMLSLEKGGSKGGGRSGDRGGR